MVINTVFSLILCSCKCGYDSYLGYNHYNGPRGLETVWLMAAPSTIHGPHHHWLWCTWLWYVEGNPIMYDSSAWLSSASSYRWWLYLCMDCLMMYVAPWSLAGIAVPVTFISVAVWFFNIGIEQNLNAQQLSEVLCDDMEGKVCQFRNE